MSSVVLGLDLGPNSVGWALVDEERRVIVRAGVRVFPEGVDRDKQGGEVSKNENRRTKRGMRRQIARRARRKRMLREVLVRVGWLPETAIQDGIESDGVDPYLLRAKAIEGKLDTRELAIVLMHLAQRRGFKSNRKAAGGKEEGVVYEGISELKQKMEAAGSPTIGAYMAMLRENPHVRVRGQYTLRKMFEDEFDLIWEKQQAFYPELMTEALREEIRGILFFQRPLHPVSKLIGRCELEKREPRCPAAHRHAQRYRMLQEVNNLRVIDTFGEERALNTEERQKVLGLLSRKEKVEFDEIRKELELFDSHGFNLEKGERGYLWGHRTDHAMRKVFGRAWDKRKESERDQIVEIVLETEDVEELKKIGREQWGLDEEASKKLGGVALQKGYLNYSLKAIDKLLPYMEIGLPLTSREGESAMAKADYPPRPDERPVKLLEILDEPPEVRNPIVARALLEVRKVVNAIIREHGKPGAIHIELGREVRGSLKEREERTIRIRQQERERRRIADILASDFGIARPSRSDIERYRLWEEFNHTCPYTGETIGKAELFSREVDVDHILPYSRSLDNSYANKVICKRSANAEKSNRTPYEWLSGDAERYEQMLHRVSHLWKLGQRGKQKKFSQKTVELDDFIARQLVDTQYISREVAKYLRTLGVDVVCTKGQTTADLRWRLGLDSVLNPNDPAVKNREDHRHHAVDAIVVGLTNRSRLQALAHSRNGDGPTMEPWEGFRKAVENAVGAINVSHRVERKIAGALHEETIYGPTSKGKLNSKVDRAWAKDWVEEEGIFVYRKPLEALTAAMVPQIRDKAIRELVERRLKDHGIEPGSQQSIPVAVWKEPLTMKSGTVIRRVRVLRSDLTIRPIRGGSAWVKPGSIHHVSIFELKDRKGKAKRIPHFVSMLDAAKQASSRRAMLKAFRQSLLDQGVRGFELKRRLREEQARIERETPIIQRRHPDHPEARFVMSLQRGEVVQAEFRGEQRLLVFRTGASTQGQLYFVDHRDARPGEKAKKYVATANSLKARKVTIDLLGRIRIAEGLDAEISLDRIDPAVLHIAQARIDDPGSHSLAWVRREMKARGVSHLGGQLSRALRLLKKP